MATRKIMPKEGSLLKINTGNGICVYARVLAHFQIAIYRKFAVSGEELLPSEIYDSGVLCIFTVMRDALTSGMWPTLDVKPLENKLMEPIEYYMKDILTGNYSIYRSSDGYIRPSTYEESKGLEVAAVWDCEQVERRMREYFKGDPITHRNT